MNNNLPPDELKAQIQELYRRESFLGIVLEVSVVDIYPSDSWVDQPIVYEE